MCGGSALAAITAPADCFPTKRPTMGEAGFLEANYWAGGSLRSCGHTTRS
jgi:hypothetical protein